MQQSIDVSCAPGAQQQTSGSEAKPENDGMGWDRRTDGQTDRRTSDTIRYDTRCYFDARSKADISRLNLPHGNDN